MGTHERVRHCRCGTRLARDNQGVMCHACTKAARNQLAEPPRVPPGFWRTPEMQAALSTCDMGAVMRAFRTHPFHGRDISQEVAAGWVGITQTRLSRIENGQQIANLNKLMRWAHVLGIPSDLLWFRVPGAPPLPAVVRTAPALHEQADPQTRSTTAGDVLPVVDVRLDVGSGPGRDIAPDWDAMSPLSRRSLLGGGIAAALPTLDDEEAQHVARAMADVRRYLDSDAVGYFSRSIGAAMARDRAVGAAEEALPVALGLVGAIGRSARDVKPAVRRELLAVGAQGAEFCGWLYRELHRPAVAYAWFDRGMEWAQEAGDTAMQGYLLLKKSQMAYDERDAVRVSTLASAAAEGPWRLPAKVQAEVVQQEALSMALLGEPMPAIERKLDRARQLFTKTPDERQHGTLGIYFTEHTLRLHTANCYTEAGAAKRAAELYGHVLTRNALPQRNAALHSARRALALARSGEPDEAATVGLEAAQVAKITHSQRTLRVLGEVVQTLGPWRSRPAPRELREALLT
jgi:tetratricopeptide (TPR) repeat protein